MTFEPYGVSRFIIRMGVGFAYRACGNLRNEHTLTGKRLLHQTDLVIVWNLLINHADNI